MMHELSICQSMLNQVGGIAKQHGALGVASITLQIGPLSCVEPALLKQAFPFAAADTIATKAELIIHELPMVIQCSHCGAKHETVANKLVCSQCGDHHTQLLAGDEMILAR